MPVEIRELIIKAVATVEGQEAESSASPQQPPVDMEAIIQECVRQVLRVLRKKKER